MTRAINEELNIEIQTLLWGLLDSISNKRKDKMDYFQVFQIERKGNHIKITNRQEQPVVNAKLELTVFHK